MLYLGGSSPCLLFPSSYCGEGLNGLSIVPKVPKFLGGSLKFSKVLLRDCEQRTDKSEPILLFSSSCDVEGLNGMFPFFPAGFFWPSFLVFYEEERIK